MAKEYVIRVTPDAQSQPVDYRVRQLPVGMGRDAANEVQVSSMFVSGQHARIEEAKGRLFVRDLGSRNGTQVCTPDGVKTRVASQALYDLSQCGNEFFLGSTVRVQVMEPEPRAAPRAPARERAPEPRPVDSFLDLPGRGTGGLDDLPPLPGGNPGVGQPRAWAAAERASERPFDDGGLSLPALPGEAARHGSLQPPRPTVPRGGSFEPVAGGAAPPGRQGVAPELRTGNFQLTIETLALQGLRELVGSLLPGQTLETRGDVARLITRLHDAAEVLCRSLVPLRQSYLKFVSGMDLEKSAHHARASMVLDMARDPAAVAATLLDFREGAPEASKSLESSLNDLTLHQVAMLDGVMQGVRALLAELSPAAVSAAADEKRSGLRLGGRQKDNWDEYCERYERLSDESEAFARIFGAEFAQAYRNYRRGGSV
jgi:predicted component of type VI protein secretion system